MEIKYCVNCKHMYSPLTNNEVNILKIYYIFIKIFKNRNLVSIIKDKWNFIVVNNVEGMNIIIAVIHVKFVQKDVFKINMLVQFNEKIFYIKFFLINSDNYFINFN